LAGAQRSYLIESSEVVTNLASALKEACTNFPQRKEVLWKAMRAVALLCVNGWWGITAWG
jgi:hypothetical protein